ncbi:MAG: DsrE family protein [Bacteroidota bacterium]
MMKATLIFLFIIISFTSLAQSQKVNPVIKDFGAIYEIPEATVKPDPNQEYRIVIDVFGGTVDKSLLDRSLNNVARMLNLHAVGGVPPEKMDVVLALHGQSTYSTLDDKTYEERFGNPNPNAELMKALKSAGVKITVCGQSLIGRNFKPDQLLDEVEVATSMLTTVTHYQNLGYMMLRF